MLKHHHKALARHCGAVILGKKPAALFALPQGGHMEAEAASIAGASGLSLLRLRNKRGRPLLFVYHPATLAFFLAHKVSRKQLKALGYPVKGTLQDMLVFLIGRIKRSGSFPHEIGFFLGYPPADVVGFIHFGGKQCKHSCMWKVYGDVEKALSLCGEYENCNRLCCRHVEMGGDLSTVQHMVKIAG